MYPGVQDSRIPISNAPRSPLPATININARVNELDRNAAIRANIQRLLAQGLTPEQAQEEIKRRMTAEGALTKAQAVTRVASALSSTPAPLPLAQAQAAPPNGGLAARRSFAFNSSPGGPQMVKPNGLPYGVDDIAGGTARGMRPPLGAVSLRPSFTLRPGGFGPALTGTRLSSISLMRPSSL